MALSGNGGLGGGGGWRCTLIPSIPALMSFWAAAFAFVAFAISKFEDTIYPNILMMASDGTAPGATNASPVERILGPDTSPDSMRSRSWRVFSHTDPMSNTLVNPYRVTMS